MHYEKVTLEALNTSGDLGDAMAYCQEYGRYQLSSSDDGESIWHWSSLMVVSSGEWTFM